MPSLKIFCATCDEFTNHDTRKMIWCEKCRGMGAPLMVAGIIIVTLAAFVVAVARIAMGGGW